MPRTLPFGLLLVLCACSIVCAAGLPAVIDFSSAPSPIVYVANKRGQWGSIAEGPFGAKRVAKLSWNIAEAHRLLEVILRDRPLLLAFDAGVTLTVEANFSQANGVAGMAIRCIDANGETYQWSVKGNPKLKGWQKLKVKLDPAKHNGHWGGDKNHVIDPPVKLLGWAMVLPTDAPTPAHVYVRHIKRNVPNPRRVNPADITRGLKVDLVPNQPLPFVTVGKADGAALTITNPLPAPTSVHVDCTLTPYGQTPIKVSKQNLRIGRSATVRVPLGNHLERLGHYVVRYSVTDATDTAIKLQGTRQLVHLTPNDPRAVPDDGFLFGICARLGKPGTAIRERNFKAISLLGTNILRGGGGWLNIQPDSPDQWNWAHDDALYADCQRYGIKQQAFLGYCPKWASGTPLDQIKTWHDWGPKAPPLDAWREYIRRMAERYKGKLNYYETWNEPDIRFFHGTTEQFVAMQKIAYEEIKKADPNAIVMTGGFATAQGHPGHQEKPDMQDRVLAEGDYDIHAHHQHGSFDYFARQIDGPFAARRAKHGVTAPIYFCETAVSSVEGNITEAEQGVQLVKKVLFSWSRGAIGYNWFLLRNRGNDVHDSEQNFGLLRHNFDPKPAYATYQVLINQLHNRKYVKQIDLGQDRYGFLFGHGNDYTLVTWSEPSAGSDEQIVIDAPGATPTVYDIMGNAISPVMVDGMHVVGVSAEPTWYVFRGSTSIPAIRAKLAGSSGVVTALVGKPVAVSVELTNPFPKTHTFDIAWQVPDSLAGTPGDSVVTLAPGEQRTLTHEFIAAKAMLGQTAPVIVVNYALAGTAATGRLSAPVEVARLIMDDNPKRAADFHVDSHAFVVDTAANDPTSSHMHWKGPADRSMQAWLDLRDGALHIKVVARDDKHHPEGEGMMIWQGDSLQIAIQLTGQRGWWELGLAGSGKRANDVTTWNWIRPNGFKQQDCKLTGTVNRTEGNGRTIYELIVPLESIGMTKQHAAQGFRINLLVNDHDGHGREGWVQLSDGLAMFKDASLYPMVVLQSAASP